MIDGIQIEGRCYTDPTTINLFKDSQRVTVIYGRNGSGKSTIGDAFEQFSYGVNADGTPGAQEVLNSEDSQRQFDEAVEDNESKLQARLLLSDEGLGRQIQTVHRRVMVFNESFVENKVKTSNHGLGTIALLGDQVSAAESLKPAEERLAACTQHLKQTQAEHTLQKEELRAASEAVRQTIKSGWAVRQKTIRRNVTNTPVNESVISKITGTRPAIGKLSTVLETLRADIAEFRTVADEQEIEPLTPLGPLPTPDSSVLAETLPPPTGAGLAKVVAESLKSHERLVREGYKIFEDSSVTDCPTCQQHVSAAHREILLAAVSAAIDAPSEALSDKLSRSKLGLLDLTGLSIDQRLDPTLITKFTVSLDRYNAEVTAWNSTCDEKMQNLYSAIAWNSDDLDTARSLVQTHHVNLESTRESFNKQVSERRKQQDQLERRNREIARYEIDAHLTRFNTAKSALHDAQKATESAHEALKMAQSEVTHIEAELKNFYVAIDEMNGYLATVFADNTRLALRLEEDQMLGHHYRLVSRGRDVRPGQLSVGERNVLALTYFFTLIREQMEVLDQSKASMRMLIVLDDPISSLDADNRVGIQGFIFSMLRSFLGSNAYTRTLFLTHDFNVAIALQAGAAEALMLPKNRNAESNAPQVQENHMEGRKLATDKVGVFVLGSSHRPEPQKGLEKLNEYKSLLEQIWRYAKASTPVTTQSEISPFIGNVTRRVVEAFSFFIYGVSSITHPRIEDEFSRCSQGKTLGIALGPGHRTLLHGQSHAPGGQNLLASSDGWGAVSDEEKVTHARRMLHVMYILQPAHVLAYLNVSDAEFKEEMTFV